MLPQRWVDSRVVTGKLNDCLALCKCCAEAPRHPNMPIIPAATPHHPTATPPHHNSRHPGGCHFEARAAASGSVVVFKYTRASTGDAARRWLGAPCVFGGGGCLAGGVTSLRCRWRLRLIRGAEPAHGLGTSIRPADAAMEGWHLREGAKEGGSRTLQCR